MMPSITFSRPCRSTLNGVCAASGKVGALLGSIIFLPLSNWLGDDKIMVVCSSISLIAAVMTLFLDDCLEETPMTKISSEALLVALNSDVGATSNLRKAGSMPSIFDEL